jgi:hypothetical protein
MQIALWLKLESIVWMRSMQAGVCSLMLLPQRRLPPLHLLYGLLLINLLCEKSRTPTPYRSIKLA